MASGCRGSCPRVSIEERLHGRVYYGWVIVVVMGIAGASIMALGTVNFGLFIKPMSEELGISRASFGWTIFGSWAVSPSCLRLALRKRAMTPF